MMHQTNPKPAKGTALMERRDKRKALVAAEEAEKRTVRLRDQVCRWARSVGSCYCIEYKNLTLHVCHLVGKGMGGRASVNVASNMILLCSLRHEGPISLHSGDCRISPLTTRGTDGPVCFEQQTEAGWTVVFAEDER